MSSSSAFVLVPKWALLCFFPMILSHLWVTLCVSQLDHILVEEGTEASRCHHTLEERQSVFKKAFLQRIRKEETPEQRTVTLGSSKLPGAPTRSRGKKPCSPWPPGRLAGPPLRPPSFPSAPNCQGCCRPVRRVAFIGSRFGQRFPPGFLGWRESPPPSPRAFLCPAAAAKA